MPSPSLQAGRRAAIVLLALASSGAAYLSWACGPWFAPWMIDDEAHLLASPVTFLSDELARAATGKPEFAAETGTLDETLEADLADLEEILAGRGVPRPARDELSRKLEAYRRYLNVVPRTEAGGDGYQAPLIHLRKDPETNRAFLPQGLPAEMADYLEGAEGYRRGEIPAARAAWERLLARPPAERRYRSTWAAYMLGRSRVDDDPEGAIAAFERTRALAREGYRDALHLAAESFGWQGRVELRRDRPEVALGLYLSHAEAGDPTARASVRTACASLFANPRALDAAVRGQRLDHALLAYVLSRWVDEGPGAEDASRTLLAALRRNGREGDAASLGLADRIAWAAYQGGDFAAAEAWIARSAPGSPLVAWLRAKLLARAGRLAEAEAALAGGVEGLPTYPVDARIRAAEDYGVPLANRPRARAELGFLQLAQGKYGDALRSLARTGYWADTAYVAERVLTTAELRALVDRHFPPRLAARHTPGDYRLLYTASYEPAAPFAAARIRDLLARRLAREGRLEAAARYFQPAARRSFADYASSLKRGRDRHRSNSARAGSLFRAACLQRRLGLLLFGTEIEPDWSIRGGYFNLGSMTEQRLEPSLHSITAASEDERRRVAASAPVPEKRFHYRYRALLLAQEAAALLPRQSERRAAYLATAGRWVAALDPTAAEPLYRDLVRSCGRTELGAEAARRRWFPPAAPSACPQDVLRLQDEPEAW